MYKAFYGRPSKTLDNHDLSVDFRMAMETFVGDYLSYYGLYAGKEMGWGSLYCDKAKKAFKKQPKKVYSIDPETKIQTRVFIKKLYAQSFRFLSDEKFIFDQMKFRSFFRKYFRKLTLLKTKAWLFHVQKLSEGIELILRDICKNKVHFLGEFIIFKLLEFRLDFELSRNYEFPDEFKFIFDKLTDDKCPIVFFDEDQFDDLMIKLNEITVDLSVSGRVKYWAETLKMMIRTAKNKEVCIGIRVFQEAQHGS